MRKQHGKGRFFAVLAVAGLIGVGTYAFTASNTVAASKAGDGNAAISGYNVTGVKYNLDALDPTKLASVEFDLDATARVVKAKLSSSGTTYYDCTSGAPLSPNHWTCSTGATPPTVASADNLRVIATD